MVKNVKEKYTGPRVKDTDTFIQRARWVHGDKYDYSKVEYKHSKSKVTIVCPQHGEWEQKAESHTVYGQGCWHCSRKNISSALSWDTEKCIEEFKKIHGDTYDYSKVVYTSSDQYVVIVCRTHGEFVKTPSHHIHRKSGCSKCQGYGLSTQDWIKRFREVHGDKYDYQKFIFDSASKKATIVCRDHGEFYQTPNAHYSNRNGCPVCKAVRVAESHTYDFNKFMELVGETHGARYEYNEDSYVNASSGIDIKCRLHGWFTQNVNSHLRGYNCPECSLSSRAEKRRMGRREFITRSAVVHNGFYKYEKVHYKNVEEKVTITCPLHGDFLQTPHSHLDGRGCHSCAKERRDLLCGYGLNGYYGTPSPANIYVLKLDDSFIKVGLAKEVHSRMDKLNKESGYSVEKLYSISGKANELFELEQKILRKSNLKRFYPEVSFGGQSECLELSELPKVLQIIEDWEEAQKDA